MEWEKYPEGFLRISVGVAEGKRRYGIEERRTYYWTTIGGYVHDTAAQAAIALVEELENRLNLEV